MFEGNGRFFLNHLALYTSKTNPYSPEQNGMPERTQHLKDVRIVEGLKLTSQCVSEETIEKWKHLKGITNELLYELANPALLIGQDNWDLIVSRKILRGKPNEPVASLTSLGWVLHGCCSRNDSRVNFIGHCRTTSVVEEAMTKRHFQLEATGTVQ